MTSQAERQRIEARQSEEEWRTTQRKLEEAEQNQAKISREKEITIQSIVDQERQILEKRYQQELERKLAEHGNKKNIQEYQHNQVKNKNERLT